MCIQHYHECWKSICVALHEIEAQRKVLQDEMLVITEEAIKGEGEGLMHS